MTSPQSSLCSASGDDRGSLLCALELVARGDVQLAQVVGAVVRHGVAFEPGPKVWARFCRRSGPLTGSDISKIKTPDSCLSWMLAVG